MYLSICLPICLYISIYLSTVRISQYIPISIYLSAYQPLHIYLLYLSTYLPIPSYLSVYPSAYTYLPIRLYLSISIESCETITPWLCGEESRGLLVMGKWNYRCGNGKPVWSLIMSSEDPGSQEAPVGEFAFTILLAEAKKWPKPTTVNYAKW